MAQVLPTYLREWTTAKVQETGVTVMPGERLASAAMEGR